MLGDCASLSAAVLAPWPHLSLDGPRAPVGARCFISSMLIELPGQMSSDEWSWVTRGPWVTPADPLMPRCWLLLARSFPFSIISWNRCSCPQCMPLITLSHIFSHPNIFTTTSVDFYEDTTRKCCPNGYYQNTVSFFFFFLIRNKY